MKMLKSAASLLYPTEITRGDCNFNWSNKVGLYYGTGT